MGTAPQPPRPPVPPAPPRTGSNIVAIVLSILALIILVCVMAIWLGVRYLSQKIQVQVEQSGSRKEVSIKTPIGALEISGEVDEARLGLPIYPGAKRMRDRESASVDIDLPGEESVRILAAKFETSDPIEKVRDFYKGRLGSEVTKFTEKDKEGKTVFEIKREGQDKIVALESKWSGTRIALVHVRHGRAETN